MGRRDLKKVENNALKHQLYFKCRVLLRENISSSLIRRSPFFGVQLDTLSLLEETHLEVNQASQNRDTNKLVASIKYVWVIATSLAVDLRYG